MAEGRRNRELREEAFDAMERGLLAAMPVWTPCDCAAALEAGLLDGTLIPQDTPLLAALRKRNG